MRMMTRSTLRLVGRSAACGLALLGVMVTAGAGATVSSATRVRFHWDWAIERPQAAAMSAVPAANGYQRVPLVHDFSHHHVIFPESVPANVYAAVLKDPRFLQQYLRRHAHLHVPFDRDHGPDPWAARRVHGVGRVRRSDGTDQFNMPIIPFTLPLAPYLSP